MLWHFPWLLIRFVQFHEFFNGRQLYFKSRGQIFSWQPLCNSTAVFFYLFSSLTQFNNFKGPRGRRRQQGNDKTEIRRYAERNEMKTHPRQIQYLCVIWDYSGSEDSHGCQIKKTQGSHTNRKWDERRKWWKKSRRRRFVDVIRALQTDSNTEGQRDERATIISRKHKRSNARKWETS